jgi:hypothetical protein
MHWFPDWRGSRALVVASGPSAGEALAGIERRPCPTIAVNNSWRLCPWADVLYAGDAEWWATGLGDEFPGLKISRSAVPGVERVYLQKTGGGLYVNRLLFEPGLLGAGGASGFQALNLAVQFGAADIALVGFDARVDLGAHWHGPHVGLRNPSALTAKSWARHLDAAAPDLTARGIRVVNCSPISALTAYPKLDLREWLNSPISAPPSTANTIAPTA